MEAILNLDFDFETDCDVAMSEERYKDWLFIKNCQNKWQDEPPLENAVV